MHTDSAYIAAVGPGRDGSQSNGELVNPLTNESVGRPMECQSLYAYLRIILS